MPTPKRGPRLGGGPAHQSLMLSNLASDLFRHGRIRTTHAKAKTLRPYAEKLITKAKRGDLHARRQVLATLRDRDVVAYLFEEVAPRFADRDGGYTRILKLGPRAGDNSPMAIIELVDRGEGSGEDTIEESKVGRSRGLFGRRRRATAEAEALTGAASIDVDDDEQVAAAIARATTGDDPSDSDDDVDDASDSDDDAVDDTSDSDDSSDSDDDAADETADESKKD